MVSSARLRRERRLQAARGYLELDLPDQALRELKAIEDPDKCPFALNQLRGEAFRRSQEHALALKAFSRALAERPSHFSTLLAMAWCYKRLDQLPQAIAATEQAYRLATEEPIILYNLACYYALSGDKTQALSWLGRAIRMEGSLRDLIPDESDFDGLRNDPDFQFVTAPKDSAELE